MTQPENGSGSANNTQPSSGESLPRLRLSPSLHEQGEMAALMTLMDMQTAERDHRRLEAAATAQFRERFGDKMQDPAADEMIQWHSPTTTNYIQPEKASTNGGKLSTVAKLITGAALLAGGGGLGALVPWYLQQKDKTPAITPGDDTDTQYGIGIYNPTGE